MPEHFSVPCPGGAGTVHDSSRERESGAGFSAVSVIVPVGLVLVLPVLTAVVICGARPALADWLLIAGLVGGLPSGHCSYQRIRRTG